MTTVSELIHTGKEHRVTFTNKDGEPLLDLSVLWTVIICVAAPQALLLVIVLALLEVIHVELDGKRITLKQNK